MAASPDLEFQQHPLAERVEEALPERTDTIVQRSPDGDFTEVSVSPSLADRTDAPDLSLFAGFLGDEFDHSGTTWWLLYMDAQLQRWLLVPRDEIVVYDRLEDSTAPFGKRDVLWINAGAQLRQGSGSTTIEGRFVVGEFTRAGDFAASTTGGTFAAATGLLCEANTPGCCWSRRTRP
jgi:hypothetical protein